MDRDHIGPLLKFHGSHMRTRWMEKVKKAFRWTRKFSKYAKHDEPSKIPNNQKATNGGMTRFNVHGPPLGSRMHRVTSDTCYNHHGGVFDPKLLVDNLETVMNLFESDNVSDARATQKQIFVHVQQFQSHSLYPTNHAWRVLERAKESLFMTVNSSSMLHGTILLDASNSGTQFYAGFLNAAGALALETSEFHIASELFRKLIGIYERSNYTSRLRDLGVAYNNLGCIAVIVGKFKSAEDDLKKSQMFLEEFQNESQSENMEVQLVAVRNNIAKLCLLQRNYAAAVSIQDQLVRFSKDQMKHMLPKGISVAVIHNYVVLHFALRNFVQVETELEWLRSFCAESEDENASLVNYISVKLYDVKRLLGKEAEDAFGLETIDCMAVSDLFLLNGHLHDNLTVASLEGLADMLVRRGKCEAASKVLKDSEQIYKDTCGSNHHHVASVLRKRGALLRLMGDSCASIECYKSALVILVDMFGSSHPDVLDCCFFLGDQLSCLGMRDESYLHFQRAVENIEVIYQVSFLDHLLVKFLEMTRMEKQMPLMNAKHIIKEDGNLIQGLVAEYGLALAVLTSAKNSSKGREEKRKLKLNREKGGIQSREQFTQFSLKDHSTVSTIPTETFSLVFTKLVYDLSRSGHSILNHGMVKESAAFFRKVCILTRHYRCFDERPDLWPTRLCPIVIVTRPEGKFFREKGEMIRARFNELAESGQRNRNTTEEWEQEFDLKLQNILLMKASTETKVLDVVFDAHDFYSKLSPHDGNFLYVNDGLQVYASRSTITCNGEKAVYDLLVSTSTILTGKAIRRSCFTSSVMFKPLAYKTGVSKDSFLVIAGINSLVDIEYLEQLKHTTLQSVKDLFQRRCFENHRNPAQFLVEVNLPSSGVIVSSGIDPSKELLQLCCLRTLSERRGTVCEIFAERTCERVTCMTFSDGRAASFVFVKALQHLLRNSPDTEIETVSIRNERLIFSLIAPSKALLTVSCEGTAIKQRTQVLTKTQRAVPRNLIPVQGHSTLTSASCSCACISKLFSQAAENCASLFGVPYTLSILKQSCSSFPDPSDNSEVGSEPLQAWNEEQQARRVLSQSSGENAMSTTIELHREHTRSLRDCLRTSLFNSLEANSIICRILDEEESQVKQEPLSGNCSSHEEEDSNEGSNLSVQCYTSGVSQHTSLFTPENPSPAVHVPHGITEQKSCFLYVDKKEEDSGCELAVRYGRLKFEEDKEKRRRLVAESQQQLQRKRQLERKQDERPRSLLISEEDETCAKTRTKIHEPVVDTQNESLSLSKHEKLMSDGSVIKQEGVSGCGLVNTDSIEMVTVHNSSTDSEGEAGALTVGSITAEQIQRSFKDINATNENINDENSIDDCQDSLNGAIAVYEEEQFQNLSPSLTILQGQVPIHVKVSKQRTVVEFDPGLDRTGKIGDSILEKSTVDSERILGEISVGHEEDEPESKEGATQNKLKHERSEERCSTIKPNPVRPSDDGAGKLSEDGSSRIKGDSQTWIGSIGVDFARNKQPFSDRGSSFTGGKGFRDLTTYDTANSCQNFNDSCGVDMVSERIPPGEDNSWKESNAKGVMQRKTVAHVESTDVNDNHIASRWIANLDVVDGLIAQTRVYPGSNTKGQTSLEMKTKEKPQRETAYTIEEGHSFAKKTKDRYSQIGSFSRSPFEGGDVIADSACEVISGKEMTNKNRYDETLQQNEWCRAQIKMEQISNLTGASNVTPSSSCSSYPPVHREMPQDKTKSLANPWVLGGARPKTKTKPVPVGSKLSEGVRPGFLSDSSYTNFGSSFLWEDQRKGSSFFDHNTLTKGALTKGFREITSYENSVKLPARNESVHSQVDQNWNFPSLLTNDGPLSEDNLCNESSKMATREGRRSPYDIDWSEYSNGEAVRDSTSPTWNCSLNRLREHFMSIVEQNGILQELSTKLVINNSSHNIQSNSDPELVATQEQLTALREEMERTIHLAALREKERQEKQGKEVEREKVEAAVRDREAEGRCNSEARGSSELSQEDQCRPIKTVAFRAPVQESPRFVCEHYQRRCLVQFPCCNGFYPCHRCHNASNACTEDQVKGVDATHFKCTVCNHRQEIDEGGQRCRKCNTKMAEYFCAICKHFTAVDKNPFHCYKCGICRIHKERSFHCEVCNVCLDKRLQGNHKCRPNSGHDECCICLEDAFSGCQILPCSHKVHKDCAIAMVQNGIRTCPVCRHPLSIQLQGGRQ